MTITTLARRHKRKVFGTSKLATIATIAASENVDSFPESAFLVTLLQGNP
jgi:hypothetical protein